MIKKVLVFLATLLLINSTYANPEGGVVAAGSATITSPDASTVQVNQASDKAIVNWQSFNISADETTRFVQPNASSIALNRIDPQQGASQIFGQIQANGQIILVNQAGIYFGPGSRVDVAGIIASTTDITNENFLAGYYIFDQKSPLYNGSIINKGTIIAANNGLIALLGSAVSNEGMVQAHLGNVVLASGNKFTVGFDNTGLINFTVDEAATSPGVDHNGTALKHGVNNSGTIIADGGTILMTAKAAQGVMDHVINMTGVAQARSVQEKNGVIILAGDDEGMTYVSGKVDASGIKVGETGGIVQVLGNFIYLDGSAEINTKGDMGGGQIYIGGNYKGKGPLPNALTTYVASDVNLFADAITQGNGGKIIVWSDVATGFEGNISARGGLHGGDGGFAETSGKVYLDVNQARVNTTSPLGTTGMWLLDPANVTISAAATSNENFAGGVFTPTTNTTANIITTGGAGLNAQLNTSSITVLATQTAGGNAGTITVSAPISWTAPTTLTLTASSDITINSTITSTSFSGSGSAGGLTLNAGGNITLSSAINTNSGAVTFSAPTGNITLNSTITTADVSSAVSMTTSPTGTAILFNAGSGVSTAAGASQTYNTSSTNIASGASVTLNAGNGNITFGTGGTTGTINGPGSLTLTSNGTITVDGGLIGVGTALAAFTTTGSGTLTSGAGSLFSPEVTTTGNQSYGTTITASSPGATIFLQGTGGGSTITLNNSVSSASGDVQLRAPGGVFLNCAACNPLINSGTLEIDRTITTPLTLLANAVITTNSVSAANIFNGAVTGAFGLTLNQAASATTSFASTINIASLTTNANGTIAFNGGNVTTTGAQVYNNAITIGTTPVTLQASAITLGAASSIAAGANNLTLKTDAITWNNASSTVTGTGAFAITPLTATTTMGLNGTGTLQIDPSKFGTTFSGITIGTAGTSTGLLTMSGFVNFGTQTVTLNAGSFSDPASFTLTAGTLNLRANSAGGTIGVDAANAFGISVTNLSVNTSNANAFITSTSLGFNFSGASAVGTGALTLTNVAGSVTQSAAGTITTTGAGSLIATLSAGALNLNTASNSIATVGAITAPGGFNLTNGNVATNVTGAINTSGANGAINISTGTGGYSQANIDIASGSGAITITSDSIALTNNTGGNAFTTTNALTLKPFTAGTLMSLAGAAAYDLSTAEITSIATGMTGGSIVIGDASGSTGSLTTGTAGGVAINFLTNNLTLNAGSFTNPGNAANIITASTLNFLARTGAIGATTAATAIRIAATNLSFNTTNSNATFASATGTNISSASSVGTGTLTLGGVGFTMGGAISQSAAGTITTTGAGSLVATLAAGALNLNSATNAISNLGVITAPGGFNLTNGNTSTTVIGAIGTTNNAVSINVGTGTYAQNNFDITAGTGAITITGDAVIIAANTGSNAFITTGALTLKPSSAATTMSLASASPSTFDLTASEVTSLSGGVTGAGTITVGDAAASTGILTIGGAVNFGAHTVTLNAGSFTDPAASIVTGTSLNFNSRNSGGSIGTNINPVAIAATNLGLLTQGNGNAFITSTGGINFGVGSSNVGTGTLSYIETGAGGAIAQTGNMTAGSLVINSIGGVVLTGSNIFSNISATNITSGAIQISTSTASGLTLSGISQAGSGQILITNPAGSIATSGTIATTGIGNIGLTAGTTASISNQINSTSGSVTLTGSAINLGANIITTGGNILFNNPVTLTASGGVSLNSAAGNTTFSSTLAGGGFSLATTTSGAGVTTFSNTVSGISSLTTTGTTAINTTDITTTGAQTYNNAVSLGAGSLTTLTSSNGGITFSGALNGPQGLSIANGSGNITFSGIVGGTALASLLIGTGDTTAINTTGITTSGSQTYNSAVNLGSDTTLSTTNNLINFASSVANAVTRSLTVSTGTAAITLTGSVGSGTALNALTLNSTGVTTIGNTVNAASITTNVGGSTVINGSTLTTTGAQIYNDAVSFGGVGASETLSASAITLASTLGAATNNLSLFGNTLTFSGGAASVTGSGTLQLGPQTAATTVGVNGAAGTLNISATDLAALGTGFSSLTIGQVGQSGTVTVPTFTFSVPTIIQSTSSISTSGTIATSGANALTLNGPITLTAPTIFSSGTGNINLQNTLTGGGFSLATSTSGAGITTFSNTLSGLSTLTTTGTTAINNTGITTTGAQNYNSAVTIGSDTVLTTTNNLVSFASTITNASARALTINAGTAAITLGGNIGTGTALGAIALNSTGTTTLSGTVNAASLTTDAGGTTAINGGSVTTNGAQNYNDAVTLGADAALSTTNNLVNFASAITNASARALTINAGTAAITLGGNVGTGTALGAIALNNTGTTTLSGTVNAASFTTDAGGTTAINGGSVTTSGAQNYNDAVTLGADAALSTTNNLVNFASTITNASARALTINAGTAAITLGGNVGTGTALGAIALNSTGLSTLGGTINAASLTTDAGGTTAINGGSVTTSGAQNYNDAVTLGADAALSATNNVINFVSTITNASARALTVDAGTAAITLSGNVGTGTALGAITLNSTGTSTVSGTINAASLTTNAGGTTAINGGSVTTSGAQNYNDGVTLGADTVFSATNNLINFVSTITNTSARALTVNAGTAAITLGGNVGTGTALGAIILNSSAGITTLSGTINAASLTTNAGGTTAINGGSITTSGAQNYNDGVTLGADTTFNTTDNLVNFASTITNATSRVLTVNAGTAAITLGGNVGTGTALGAIALNSTGTTTISGSTVNAASMTTNTGGTTAINGSSVTTSGAQTYNDAVTLGGGGLTTLTSTGSNGITFNNTLNGPQGLSIANNSGNVTFNNTVGDTLASLLIGTGNPTAINLSSIGLFSTTGSQTFNSAVNLNAGTFTLFGSTGGSGITFGSTVDGLRGIQISANSGTITFSGIVGGINPLTNILIDIGNPTAINTTAITVGGSQTYNSAVNLGAGSLTTLTSNGSGGQVNFNSTLDGPQALSIVNNGNLTFADTVGGASPLTSLLISAADSGRFVNITTSSVTTSGSQTYNRAINLGSSGGLATLTTTNSAATFSDITNTLARSLTINTGNGAINLTGPVGFTGGLNALALNSTGTTTIGNTVNAASITTNVGGTTAVNGGSITTSGTQTYNDTVTLGANTALTGAGITLNNVTGGAQSLTLSDSVTSILNGAITGLTTLLTDAVTFNNGNVSSTGNQTYNGIATLGASTVLTSNASDITLNNSLIGGALSLTLTGGAGGNHVFTLNNITSLDTLTVNGNSSVTNTLALLTSSGTNTWTIASPNTGTLAATNIANGGFNNIQTLAGGSATNNFVFNDGATIDGSILGGGAGSNNTLNFSAYSTAVSINAAGTSTGLGGTFSGLNNFIGGTGSNTFTNATGSNTWNISNNNAGSISGKNFSAFGSLVGGSGDTFAIANGKSIGSISATAGTLN